MDIKMASEGGGGGSEQCYSGVHFPPGDGDIPSAPVIAFDEGVRVQSFGSTPKLDDYESRVANARKMLVSHLPNHPPVTLQFSELNFSVGETPPPSNKFGGLFGPYTPRRMKSILKNVSGIAKPGELTAIMGPSGAGKSTLMNILAGYQTHNVQGSISVNGSRRDLSQFRRMSCYIMQDDVLLPHLTVHESMKYAAQLKLPRKTVKPHRQLVIEEIIDILGLAECQNVRASAISGGQRKRLAIGLELINNPPILFFDEPTSGLDSASCYSVVALLKALAQGGRTIVATIHQPSTRIFEQFDSLYLLAGGECLYQGPTRSVVPWVARQGLQCPLYHNPADFVIDIASGEYGAQWTSILSKATVLGGSDSDSSGLAKDCSDGASSEGIDDGSLTSPPLTTPSKNGSSKFKPDPRDPHNEKELTRTLIQPETETNENNHCVFKSVHEDSRIDLFANQFFTLLRRSFLCATRDMMVTHLRFAATVIIALLIGVVYHDAGNDASKVFMNTGNLLFGLLFMVFLSMMSTVLTFPLERGVVIREHLNCWYSLKAYFLARTCADLPFQVFFPLLYVATTYFMTDQPREAFRFGIVAGTHVGIALVAQSYGLLVGAAFNVGNAIFVAPVTSIPIFLFAGFFVTLNTVPLFLSWVSWFSYPKYCFQSTLTAIYGLNRDNLKCTQAYCHFKHSEKFLEQIDAVDIDVGFQFTCLLGIFVALRITAYYALRIKIMLDKQNK